MLFARDVIVYAGSWSQFALRPKTRSYVPFAHEMTSLLFMVAICLGANVAVTVRVLPGRSRVDDGLNWKLATRGISIVAGSRVELLVIVKSKS